MRKDKTQLFTDPENKTVDQRRVNINGRVNKNEFNNLKADDSGHVGSLAAQTSEESISLCCTFSIATFFFSAEQINRFQRRAASAIIKSLLFFRLSLLSLSISASALFVTHGSICVAPLLLVLSFPHQPSFSPPSALARPFSGSIKLQ